MEQQEQFAKGFAEGTWGTAKGLWALSQVAGKCQYGDCDSVGQLVKGVASDPIGAAAGMIDWDDLSQGNIPRWAGNLAPGAILAMLTGGSGEATAAVRAEESAVSIIERTAQEQAARGVQALKGSLSPREIAAFDANPEAGSRYLGQAVHRATRDALAQEFPDRFWYRNRGIDFVDKWTGEMIELTTPGQRASHIARPGYAGAGYAHYQLMPWIP